MAKHLTLFLALIPCGTLLPAPPAQAITWRDTFVGYRYSADFHDPGNPQPLEKHVLQLFHANGHSLGQHFANLDILHSDSNDPARDSTNGATEVYLTYRHQLHLGKALGRDLSLGPVKEVAITAGADLNSKNTRMAPQKRLLVIGPTLKFDVPGFFDLSLLAAQEWNHCGLGPPLCQESDIAFDRQWMLNATWGIPCQLGAVSLKFQGFLIHGSEKGPDHAGVATEAETLMRTSLLADVGQMLGGKKNTFWLGVGYELWRNKFGNHSYANGASKPGLDSDAPTVQMEWHF